MFAWLSGPRIATIVARRDHRKIGGPANSIRRGEGDPFERIGCKSAVRIRDCLECARKRRKPRPLASVAGLKNLALFADCDEPIISKDDAVKAVIRSGIPAFPTKPITGGQNETIIPHRNEHLSCKDYAAEALFGPGVYKFPGDAIRRNHNRSFVSNRHESVVTERD